jgi:hypothetical protein
MESQQKSTTAGFHFASGRCVVEPTQEDAWKDDNLVHEFCSGACMCIFWPRPKENLLALASDGFLQNLALEPLRAIRQIGRRTGEVGANFVRGNL